jgi:hypothetical protein
MNQGSPVWCPSKDGGLMRAIIVSVHGPVTRCQYWNGKKHETLDVATNMLTPFVEGEPPAISLGHQIAAVKREVAMRESVYPKRVEAKAMSQDKADFQIAAMKAVLATLEGLKV